MNATAPPVTVKLLANQLRQPPALVNTDALIARYFEPQDRPTARAIVLAESGNRPEARQLNTNKTVDRGLFQINSVHANRVTNLDDLYDSETNVRIAAQIHAEQGWRPWVTYWTGKYKQYLNKDLRP